MALNFPDNPGIGSVFVDTNSGFSFKWDGTVWNGFAGSSASEISNLDNIAGSFNGSTTTFALAKGGASVSPLSAVQLRVVLGGVTQTAGTDYTISGSNITFTTAPLAGLTCTITQLGVALSLADPANGSVTPAKLSTGGPSWNSSGDVYISGIATANNGLVVGVGLTLADDVKLNLGDDNDLQIVHDGSNSLIDGAGTGGVHLKSNTEIKFLKRTGSENILVGTADGSVAAFYDNTKRLETTDGGALVYGTVGAGQTALVVEGDIKATGVVTAVSFNGDLVGTAATTNSTGLHVVGVATVLNVNATNVTAGVVTATTFSGALSGNATSATTATTATNITVADESSDTSCNVLFATAATGDLAPKSGTNLTFNSSSGALTATSFVGNLTGNVTGNATGLSGTPSIDCGTGSFTGDVDIADKIVHTGDTNTAIRFPSTDTITFETSGSEQLRITSAGNVSMVSGATILYGDGDVLFTGDSGNFNWDKSDSSLKLQDNATAKFGTGNDLQIYHNGTTSFIDNATGNITIRNSANDADVNLLTDNGSGGTTDYVQCDGSTGEVKLFHYGTQKFKTKSDGIDVTGEVQCDSLDVDGAADITGDVTIADKIVHSGDTNTAIRFPANDTFTVETAGNERFRIESDGGTTASNNLTLDEDGRLLIANTSSFANASIDDLVIGDSSSSTQRGLTIGSTDECAIAFADAGDSRAGSITYNHGSNSMIFKTSGQNERLVIASNGVVTAKNGAVAEIDTLTSATSITPDFAASCNFTLTLGHNVTLNNPSNLTAGQTGSIFLVQDGTGSRTLTFGSYYDFAGGTAPTISTAASSVDRLDYIVRSSTSIHCVVTLAYS